MFSPRRSLPLLRVLLLALSAVSCSSPAPTPAAGDPGGTGGTGTAGTGGTVAGTGGTVAGSGGTAAGGRGSGGSAGAAAGTAGAPAVGGAAGAMNAGTGLPDVGCDYTTIINTSCAITACHKVPYKIGGLNLTLDTGIRSRLVNVPATFADIECGTTTMSMICVPTTCPTGAKLIDTTNPEQSYMLTKLEGTQNGCGQTMPSGDMAMAAWTADQKACLESLVRAVASGK